MEVANFRSLAELGVDHGFGHQTWQPPMMSSLDDELNALSSSMAASAATATLIGEHYHHHHMHPSNNNNYDEMFFSQLKQYSLQDLSHQQNELVLHRPAKQQKTNSSATTTTTTTVTTDHHHHNHISSNPQNTIDIIPSPNNYHMANSVSAAYSVKRRPKEEMMNFPQPHDIMMVSQQGGSASVCNQNYIFNPTSQEANKRTTTTTNARLTQAQDHIMAERKRREKLSQRFIQLSALVPGLKKMDKASVLGDAIKYLKQLQEKVKNLEEQINRKRTMESVVYVKKYELCAHDNYSSSNENVSSGSAASTDPVINEPLPEIEARLSEKNVLIRIHCEKGKGIIDKTLAEIEKLPVSVINSSVMSFGSSVLDMTIIAEVEEDFSMSMKDLVKKLRDALMKFL